MARPTHKLEVLWDKIAHERFAKAPTKEAVTKNRCRLAVLSSI